MTNTNTSAKEHWCWILRGKGNSFGQQPACLESRTGWGAQGWWTVDVPRELKDMDNRKRTNNGVKYLGWGEGKPPKRAEQSQSKQATNQKKVINNVEKKIKDLFTLFQGINIMFADILIPDRVQRIQLRDWPGFEDINIKPCVDFKLGRCTFPRRNWPYLDPKDQAPGFPT